MQNAPPIPVNVDPRSAPLESFRDGVAGLPWFESIGDPTDWDDGVVRVDEWEDVPSVESPGRDLLSCRLTAWTEQIDQLVADRHVGYPQKDISFVVFESAIHNVDYLTIEDPWHAPSSAVLEACFVAELVGKHIFVSADVPEELSRIWSWFANGHWPLGYSEGVWAGAPGDLLVF